MLALAGAGFAAGAPDGVKGNISPAGAEAAAWTGRATGAETATGTVGGAAGTTGTGSTGAGGSARTGSGLTGEATDVSPVNGFLYSLLAWMTSMELG